MKLVTPPKILSNEAGHSFTIDATSTATMAKQISKVVSSEQIDRESFDLNILHAASHGSQCSPISFELNKHTLSLQAGLDTTSNTKSVLRVLSSKARILIL